MGEAQLQPRYYSVAEYMELEARSEVRHEYFEGEVFAMAGASKRHNMLAGNCYIALRAGLRGKSCRAYFESVQLAVEAGRHYNYPDVAVTCNADDLRAERTISSPVLLIEVLSKSTENRDRSWKFNQYKQLPSLRHYLLVSQETCLVEWYRREENDTWSFMPFMRFADEIVLPELDVKLCLRDIYEDTDVAQMAVHPEAE